MSKKNKNKQQQKQQQQKVAQPVTQPKTPELSDDQKLEIKTLDEETTQKVSEQGLTSNVELSTESTTKLQESETKSDLPKYWNFVKGINKKLETLISKTEEEKGKTEKLNSDLQTSIKDNDSKKAEYTKKIEEFNKKDKELTEREFALDNGEYTGIIKRLLDCIKETEKTVFTDTENLLKDLKKFHKDNIEEFSAHLQENTEFETEKSNLKREKKKFEIEKKIFEENVRAEYETKYSEELTLKKDELEKLNRQFEKLKIENEKLNKLIEDIKNAFNNVEPTEMLKQQTALKEEVEKLNGELNDRPEKNDYNAKVQQIEELKAKVTDYQSKVNEGELLELKRILNNQNNYIIEINGYKNQIESAKVREQSLQKTVADLQVTIDQLKGESAKKEDAFEFAKKCDTDKTNLGRNQLDNKIPNNLKELVEYTQQKMAFHSDKPFYYSEETIRTFLAGLYMSPISILQGISGTGKTSLPREFAKALITDSKYLGINSGDNTNNAAYRICAVQSGWRDNMDLMGYYNSFEHKYKETDFFKALYLANQPKYSDTLFFIILDEMNLSRPEHYFADFLSLLEQSENERYINLTNTPEEVLPALIKGGKLKVPENVRFIGTANHDETTLEFAPKTYDRSNLMEMPKNLPDKSKIKKQDIAYNITYKWLAEQFKQAEEKNKTEFDKFQTFINSDAIQLLLMEKGIGTGNRLEDQAKRFIGVYLAAGGKLSEAVDHLIASRLLRTLKNRYDLDKNNLTDFKKKYVEAFEKAFEKAKPQIAIELLDTEISKK